jgi:hypothetical protein
MNIGLQIVGKTYQLSLTPETAEEKAIVELLKGCEVSHDFTTHNEQLAVDRGGSVRCFGENNCDRSLMFTFTPKLPESIVT